MRVTVLGCTGSMSGPHAPASGYLFEITEGRAFVIDLGPGTMGQLQRYCDPSEVDVVLTHLHSDHCLDIPGLAVWRRYHPTAPARCRNLLYGPQDTATRLGLAGADHSSEPDDLSDTFDVRNIQADQPFEVAGATVTPVAMVHPVEAYGYRVTANGKTVAYTGDTAWTDNLITLAQDADVLIAEATWCGSAAGKPRGMHLSGTEAGIAAQRAGVGKLILTHIPPYGDPEEALASASSEFSGPVEVAHLGMVLQL